MGFGLIDKKTKYDEQISCIQTAVAGPAAIGYFGLAITPDTIRLGCFTNSKKAGVFSPIGDAVLGDASGLHIPNGATAGSRWVAPVLNSGTNGTLIAVVKDTGGGQVFSWGGLRLRLQTNGAISAESIGREYTWAASDTGVDSSKSQCISLNISGGDATLTVFNLDRSVKYTNTKNRTAWLVDAQAFYFGGTAVSTGLVGVDVYAGVMFNTSLSVAETALQAAQLIAFSNYVGAGDV